MSIETVMDEKNVRRYQQASEWLVCLRSTCPSELEVERWLTWCEEDAQNLAAFEELDRDWNDLEGLRSEPELIQASDRQILGSQMRARTPKRGLTVGRPIKWLSAMAATILVLWVAGYEFWSKAPEAPRLVTSAHWKPAVLPDGSSLVLSAKAAAEVDFTGINRDLKLRPEGEAYIKVHHDKTRPFVVQAGTVTVTAVGTAFDVRREGDHVTVTVEEGTIRVTAPGSEGTLQWQASAGYQIDYSEHDKTAVIASIDVARMLQWRSGELSYDFGIMSPLASLPDEVFSRRRQLKRRSMQLARRSSSPRRRGSALHDSPLSRYAGAYLAWPISSRSIFPVELSWNLK
jgi:transmembrane sensor